MSEQTEQIFYLVLGGTIILLIVLSFTASFINLYHKRQVKHKLTLKQIELDRQQELLTAVINTQEKERQYFARELHDSVGQMLSAIKLNMSGMKRTLANKGEIDSIIDQSMNLTVQSIQEVRAISHSLLPGVLLDFGLKEAIIQLLHPLEHAGMNVSFSYETKGEEIKQETELALFRISQELINNTIKYAGATEVWLFLSASNESLLYSYADNGVGFNPEDFAAGGKKKGLGLRNVESRVKMINGQISWHSSGGNGLKVNIEIPQKGYWQKDN